MSIDATQIARRFAGLTPEGRKAFLAKLAANGIDFAALPIVPVQDRETLPLSDAQRGLWLTWQRDPENPAYNLTGILTVAGPIDRDVLQDALDGLVRRHESLRTTFLLGAEGEPYQRVHAAMPVPVILREDVRDERQSRARAETLARTPFDLETGPLLRIELHRLGEDDSRLVLGFHHIVADGWSIGLFLRDLAALYAARRNDLPDGLPPMPVQYADYAAWQRHRLEAGEAGRQIAFWRDRLGSGDEPTPLPLDRPRRAQRDDAGGSRDLALPPDLSEALRALARREGATTFMAVLSLFALTLARFGDTETVRIGTPLANRERPETQPMIGYFTNLAVLSLDIDQRDGFRALLAAVRERVLAAQSHVDVPFDRLVEALAPPHRPGLHPFFQVKVTEQAGMPVGGRFAGMPMRLAGIDSGAAHFDLSLDLLDRPDGIACRIAYARDLFDPETIAALADGFAALAADVAAEPDRPLHAVGTRSRETAGGPRPEPAQDVVDDIVDSWRAHAALAPDAVALRQDGTTRSRAELDRASDRLAARLLASGLRGDEPVALLMERSPEWVAALLAVLKAGGAYLPLDPALPRERVAALIADSGARRIVTDGPDDHGLARFTVSFADEPVTTALSLTRTLPRAEPDQAAYLIYTSGSTGRPKGVVVTRGGLASYVRGAIDRLAITPGLRLAMASTVAADLGNTVLFGALAAGAELDLIDRKTAFDPDAFAAHMAQHRIDALKIVPSHLGALLQASRPADVLPGTLLVLGGEPLPWSLVERVAALKPGCRVVNHYGPTEATVGALCQDAAQAERAAGTVPIGRPLDGAAAHVLDLWLCPVPVGATGELHLGGRTLGRGYLGRAAATAERFVPDPFGAPGARLYRTGDRVRRLRDGSLEFRGRADDQVKIRGHRVEPGEAAAFLRGLDGVRDAAVVAVAEGEDRDRLQLAGYVVAQESVDLDALRRQATRHLPEALVPASLTRLAALPLTPNGKLDRRALPLPPKPRRSAEPPRVGAEADLATIWANLLGLEPGEIGRAQSFADLGGDSILSLKMLARIRKQGFPGGKGLTLAAILNAESLAALAARLAPAQAAPAEPSSVELVRLHEGGSGVPLFCIPGLIANATEFTGLAESLGGRRPVLGFVSHVHTRRRWHGYDIAALSDAYAASIAGITRGGRCALIGWSSGGDLAFETARRLEGRAEVAFLGLVDVFESVPFGSDRPLDDADRGRAAGRLAPWLARSRMARHWRALIARMDGEERSGLDAYLADSAEEPPADGPDLDSREFELWALLDKRIRAKRHVYAPLPCPVHVWQAEDSLTRSERLRDWSLLAPVASHVTVPGTRHLDIVRHAVFRRSVAEMLDRATD
ncbi:MAG: amino acid adenylation domain-containing protein [Methylorubrum populi]